MSQLSFGENQPVEFGYCALCVNFCGSEIYSLATRDKKCNIVGRLHSIT